MKKALVFILVCLMLTACGGPESVMESTTEVTTPPVSGLYDSENSIESSTNGAVRAYLLDGNDHTGLLNIGEKLVLFSDKKLTLLQGDVCEILMKKDVAEEIYPAHISVSSAETGMAYYESENNQIVLLNPYLQQSKVYDLPESLQGKPAICLSSQQAYYCDGQELRSLDLQTGISRLIRTFTEERVELFGIYFEGRILGCEIYAGESSNRVYISTENGKTLSEDKGIYNLKTMGDQYFTERIDGSVNQRIFGKLNENAKSLNLDNAVDFLVAALPMNGVVRYYSDDVGLQLSFYNLESGRKTSAVTLEGVSQPVAFHSDDRYVWMIAIENEKQVLYRWDPSLSAVSDETVYTGTLYTYQNPDTEGLAQLKKRVEEMNQNYGVRIAIWEDAMKTPGNYTFKPEHQVSAISAKLDELETILAQFPKKFLQVTVEAGWIRICLVRSVESGEPYVQYWSGGDCYGAISMDANIKEAFLICAAYGIDSHVMGNSRDFDTWNNLNPTGFSYGQEVNTKYLEGSNRAFTDEESMMNPHKDRSHIIACAIMEGNAEVFASATMQAKLLRACEGIREAYGLEKSTETYIWEQYLNQSLAYTK